MAESQRCGTSAHTGTPSPVHDFVEVHTDEMVEQLSDWVRIASVAGVPERAPNIIRSANWLASAFRDFGFPTVHVWSTGDTSAVYAEWCGAPGAPTVLVYSHHDVRAVKESLWDQTPPFEPALRHGRLYGRGSSDAKGQVLAHLWGVRAHLAARGLRAPAVNLKFLIEGEEEMGSPHFAEALERYGDLLGCDLVVYSDTMQWKTDHPAICTSVRGMLSAHIEVYGPLRDVHSGAVSGVAPNPVFELSRLLARLHDERGAIAVPGFYDAVASPSPARRAELAALPFDEADWLDRSETRSIGGEDGYSVFERLWARPAVEVTSIIAGDPVGASRAAVPSMAAADLSFRLVPNQQVHTIADTLRAWVAAEISPRVQYALTLSEETAQEPYVTPKIPAVEALERAIRKGCCTATVGRMGNAGGGPAALLASSLGAPLVFYGTGLVEDHWHDSDESIRIDVLQYTAATLAFYWSELADPGSAAP